MITLPRLALASLTLGAAVFAAGCASQSPAATIASDQAVTCSKCKVTWVKSPVLGDKNRIVAYSNTRSMTCPDCKDAVASFFAAGKLQHTCKTCGDSMEICQSH